MKRDSLGRASIGTTPNYSQWRTHIPPGYLGPSQLKIDVKALLFDPGIAPRRVFELRDWSICERRDLDELGCTRSWWLVVCDVDDLSSGDRREVILTYSQSFRAAHGLDSDEELMLHARARMTEELTPLVGTHGWSGANHAIRIECF